MADITKPKEDRYTNRKSILRCAEYTINYCLEVDSEFPFIHGNLTPFQVVALKYVYGLYHPDFVKCVVDCKEGYMYKKPFYFDFASDGELEEFLNFVEELNAT